MKQMLASQEILHPRLFYSLKETLHPLMEKNKTGMESKRNINDVVTSNEPDLHRKTYRCFKTK